MIAHSSRCFSFFIGPTSCSIRFSLNGSFRNASRGILLTRLQPGEPSAVVEDDGPHGIQPPEDGANAPAKSPGQACRCSDVWASLLLRTALSTYPVLSRLRPDSHEHAAARRGR
jgi:hypothetical protein